MYTTSYARATNGLSKRTAFIGRLKEALDQPQPGQPVAVLCINLDQFQLINHTLSYNAGDQLILEAALRLGNCLQPENTLTHLAADGFAVLIEKGQTATEVVECIQLALAAPFNIKGEAIFVSASIGIAQGESGMVTLPENLLRNANLAMYEAQLRGPGHYAIYDQTMRVKAVERFDLESEMRRALKQNEFQVYYQPVVALGSGEFKGFEALVRWQHPQRGFLHPHEFMPIAEETGLSGPISDWVLREACCQSQDWQLRFGAKLPISIDVNLSAYQFADPGLLDQVEQALSLSGLNATQLKLEITEGVLMRDPELTVRQLVQLKVLGVQLHLDDFGKGNSSLGWLSRFPIDLVKVDKRFLLQMTAHSKTHQIIKAIVSLGHDLGIAVVAKGVETETQLEQIRDLKFDYIQGYFLSEPLSKQDAANWLTELIEVNRGRVAQG